MRAGRVPRSKKREAHTWQRGGGGRAPRCTEGEPAKRDGALRQRRLCTHACSTAMNFRSGFRARHCITVSYSRFVLVCWMLLFAPVAYSSTVFSQPLQKKKGSKEVERGGVRVRHSGNIGRGTVSRHPPLRNAARHVASTYTSSCECLRQGRGGGDYDASWVPGRRSARRYRRGAKPTERGGHLWLHGRSWPQCCTCAWRQ